MHKLHDMFPNKIPIGNRIANSEATINAQCTLTKNKSTPEKHANFLICTICDNCFGLTGLQIDRQLYLGIFANHK